MFRPTNFNSAWLQEEQFKPWLAAVEKDNHKAKCTVCGLTFELSNMGKQALISHSKGKKHIEKMKYASKAKQEQPQLKSFFLPKSTKDTTSTETAQSEDLKVSDPSAGIAKASTSAPSTSLTQCISKDDVLTAEVLWAIKTVMSHYSMNSSANTSELFKTMFPDSQIAQKFNCGKTKCSYLITHGLATYFHDRMLASLKDGDVKYVISFDESLNRTQQQEQMDVIVRFWDNEKNKVCSRYFDSNFLGHTSAQDLLKSLQSSLTTLNPMGLIQLSMDGPSTNWKLYDELSKDRANSDPDLPELINVGSCGLHIIHGAFKRGAVATGWHIDNLLRSLWYLFSDAPAKKEDFIKISESKKFPLQFCATRWLEDIAVAERAILIWPDVQKFITQICAGSKSKIPKSHSFTTLQGMTRDLLVPAKLQFFCTIAKVLQPYLEVFQRERPMLPFMAEYLFDILHNILDKFIKKSVLAEVTSMAKLANIDVMKKENLLNAKDVDVGFAAKKLVTDLQRKKKVSERQILEYQNECQVFLQSLTAKLLDRCPLQYPVVRNIVCLDLKYMAGHPDEATDKMRKLLEKLMNLKQRSADDCDSVMRQYKIFIGEVGRHTREEFSAFNHIDDELDTFLFTHLGKKPRFEELWSLVKLLLTLSHGQSQVERGFSVNKDITSTNMAAETLIAFRRVHDGVQSLGLPMEQCVTAEMLRQCKFARSHYQFHLDELKRESNETERERKRKAMKEELEQTEKKKKRLDSTVTSLVREADQLALDAEEQNEMSMLTKSNALRSKAKEKRAELEAEKQKIEDLKSKL